MVVRRGSRGAAGSDCEEQAMVDEDWLRRVEMGGRALLRGLSLRGRKDGGMNWMDSVHEIVLARVSSGGGGRRG